MHLSQSPSGNHANLTMPNPHSTRWPKLFNGKARVVSSSGRSYMLTELCICMDFSRLQQVQTSALGVVTPGRYFLTSTGDLKCRACSLVRPSRITSLNIA